MKISPSDFIIALLTFSIILFGLTLSIFLFLKKTGKRISHIFLGLLVGFGCLVLTDYLIHIIGLPGQFNQLYYLPLDFGLVIGPLQFLYFKSKLKTGYQFQRKDWIHFLLPAIQAAVIVYVGFSSVSFKYKVWQSGFMDTFLMTISMLFPIVCSFYAYRSFLMLKEKTANPKYWKSKLYGWLKKFLFVFVILIIVQSVFLILQRFPGTNYTLIRYLEFFILILLLLWFCVKALQQYYPQFIYTGQNLEKLALTDIEKYDELTFFKTKTSLLFKDRQIFTNPDLNLDILKREYSMSARKVSELIKVVYGQSFTEFVNGYRVAYVLAALKKGEHKSLTLQAIAFDAGFSSKSTFYRSFKQVTKHSPTEYLTLITQKNTF